MTFSGKVSGAIKSGKTAINKKNAVKEKSAYSGISSEIYGHATIPRKLDAKNGIAPSA